MNVLAICGSLRAASINAALLRAAARLSPPEIQVKPLSGIGELPLFNPDLEHHRPVPVAAYQAEVTSADALLIASPEYAHGVTGTIKNALDWLVSFKPFADKPVAVLNASPRAHDADDALRETLKTMSAVVVEQASITVPLLGAHLTEDGMVEDPTISRAIRGALEALYSFVVLRKHEHSAPALIDTVGCRETIARGPLRAMPAKAVALLSEAECRELESLLADRIYEFNSQATGYFDGRLLAGSILDDAGEVIAGFSGHTWGGCCYISHVWVHEQHRGKGLGKTLLQVAETEARHRGCMQVVLLTHSFQAPGFYEHLGYERKYAIEGRPKGHSDIVYVKLLQGEGRCRERLQATTRSSN